MWWDSFGPWLVVGLCNIHNFVRHCECETRSNVIDSDFICKGLGNHTKRDYVIVQLYWSKVALIEFLVVRIWSGGQSKKRRVDCQTMTNNHHLSISQDLFEVWQHNWVRIGDFYTNKICLWVFFFEDFVQCFAALCLLFFGATFLHNWVKSADWF